MINACAADAVGRPGAQILIARRTPTNMMMMKETRSRAQPRRTGTPPRHRRGVAGRMKTVAAGPPAPSFRGSGEDSEDNEDSADFMKVETGTKSSSVPVSVARTS